MGEHRRELTTRESFQRYGNAANTFGEVGVIVLAVLSILMGLALILNGALS